jgi:hypothetical protein
MDTGCRSNVPTHENLNMEHTCESYISDIWRNAAPEWAKGTREYCLMIQLYLSGLFCCRSSGGPGPFQFRKLETGNVHHKSASQSDISAAFPYSFPFPNRGGNRSFPPWVRNQDKISNNSCIGPGCTRVHVKAGRMTRTTGSTFWVSCASCLL